MIIVDEFPENRAWRSHLSASAEDWRSGQISDRALCDAILDEASPATAAAALDAVGADAATCFEHWFVAAFGDAISLRYRTLQSNDPEWPRRQARYRVLEAFHRAILARREPI